MMKHPLTGRVLHPLYVDKYGMVHWPIMGASEGSNEAGTGQSAGSGGGAADSGGGAADSGGSSGAGTQSGAGKEADTVPKAELEAVQERMRAADQRASKLEADLKALRDKDLDEKTRAENEAKEAKEALADAKKVIDGLRLEVAFLRDTSYTWHDPSDVLRFVTDDERVTIGEDGKVSGMEAALKDLATKKPYLVKKAEDEQPPGASGERMGGRGGNTQPERSKLLEAYPSLRGRTKSAR